jgi:hypothetical protein
MSDTNVPCKVCSYDPTLKILGSWLIELPFEAKSSNALKGNGRGRSGFMYRKLRDDYHAYLKPNVQHIPTATHKRRVFFTRHYCPPAKRFDTDNLAHGFKCLRDCLTMLNLIKDDNEKWLESHYSQVKGAHNYMTITIEDVSW